MTCESSAKIIIVAYNTKASDSTTIKSLCGISKSINADVVVRDNSPTQFISQESVENLLSSFSSIRVEWDGQNKPLSKIYNDTLNDPGQHDWFILLDDDTDIPQNFLSEIFKSEHVAPNADLALPVVMCGKRIVSPGDYQFIKGRHWDKPKRGLLPSASVVAITSGMAIRSRYIRQYPRPFDEQLSFYGIDTRFCLDYRTRRSAIYVTNSTLQHDSALWKHQNSEERRRRFKMLKRATYQIHRGRPVKILALFALNFVSSIRRAITFRDIRYIL